MQNRLLSPPVRAFLPTAILLILLGWGGIIAIILYTYPSGGTRWLLFFAGMLAITGTALPVMALLNRRFPSAPPPTQGVIVRQAVWVGMYGAILAWLQLGRVLSPAVAALLAAGFILMEWLLRMRERAQWKP